MKIARSRRVDWFLFTWGNEIPDLWIRIFHFHCEKDRKWSSDLMPRSSKHETVKINRIEQNFDQSNVEKKKKKKGKKSDLSSEAIATKPDLIEACNSRLELRELFGTYSNRSHARRWDRAWERGREGSDEKPGVEMGVWALLAYIGIGDGSSTFSR